MLSGVPAEVVLFQGYLQIPTEETPLFRLIDLEDILMHQDILQKVCVYALSRKYSLFTICPA
jgi:hypothetical protein